MIDTDTTVTTENLAAATAEDTHEWLVYKIERLLTKVYGSADTEQAASVAALVAAEFAAHAENDARTAQAAVAELPTVAYISVTRDVNVYANCHGINHSDAGEIVTHDRCGVQVVRREDGNIYDVVRVGRYDARKFQCWRGAHRCDPNMVAHTDRQRAQEAADGKVDVKGAQVEVVKGRKVAKGTTGRVFWVGEDGWGKVKIGFTTDAGDKHFTVADNCRRIG
jgi:hypothetical protein